MNLVLPVKYSAHMTKAIGQFIWFKRHILNWNRIYRCVDGFYSFLSVFISLPLFLYVSLTFCLLFTLFQCFLFVCLAFDCTCAIGDKSIGMYVYVNVECRTKTHSSILKIMVLDNKWLSTYVWYTNIASSRKKITYVKRVYCENT